MSLPTLSTLNTTQDTNKQLAIMRSYLVQLKDELESELSNVTYEMLSASLQKKIDAINEDIANNRNQGEIMAQMITTNYASVGELVAGAISTSELYADQVSAEALRVANANIATLDAKIVDAKYVTTDYLTSNYITSNTISTTYATSSWVSTNYLQTSSLYSQIAALNGVSAKTITCSSYTVASPKGTSRLYTLRPSVFTLGSKNRVILSADYAET